MVLHESLLPPNHRTDQLHLLRLQGRLAECYAAVGFSVLLKSRFDIEDGRFDVLRALLDGPDALVGRCFVVQNADYQIPVDDLSATGTILNIATEVTSRYRSASLR